MINKSFNNYLFITLLFLLFTPVVFGQTVIKDGTYSAIVNTDSGSYNEAVDVSNNSVVIVHWENGGNMNVYGAMLDENCSASGTNSRGDQISIQINNCKEAKQ